MKTVTKNRLMLVSIALLFFVPLAVAMLMQSDWWGYQPAQTTNRGLLVDPPVTLNIDSLAVQHEASVHPGRTPWTLVMPIPAVCDQSCVDAVSGLRQIHRAAGRHQQDLSIALISRTALAAQEVARLNSIYPEFRLLSADALVPDALITDVLKAAGAQVTQPFSGHAMILDPASKLILVYPPPLRATDINKDLKRLFKYSGEDPA